MRNATEITTVLPTSDPIPCVLGFGLTSHFGELKIPNAFAGSEPSDRGGFSANQSKNCIFEAVKIRLNQLYVLSGTNTLTSVLVPGFIYAFDQSDSLYRNQRCHSHRMRACRKLLL